MKLSAKSMSSPGRAEKYPPPLMRFLRSNVGSRSRGRSRTSPMFVRKKNTAIETQEPSSPKVTCMGQVRVRRSKQASSRPGRSGAPTRRRCKWIRKALLCHHCAEKPKTKLVRPNWRKWVMFCHVGFGRKSRIREDSWRSEPKFGGVTARSVQEEDEEESEKDDEQEAPKVLVSSPSTPPKNALLLTRCRSAPYRSSSLASRFWGSPLANEEDKSEEEKQKTGQQNKEEDDSSTSEKDSISKDAGQESRMDAETERNASFFKELEGSIEENIAKSANTEELNTELTAPLRPIILTRCKSEPARTGEKLNPDITLWKKRRVGNFPGKWACLVMSKGEKTGSGLEDLLIESMDLDMPTSLSIHNLSKRNQENMSANVASLGISA